MRRAREKETFGRTMCGVGRPAHNAQRGMTGESAQETNNALFQYQTNDLQEAKPAAYHVAQSHQDTQDNQQRMRLDANHQATHQQEE